ncbi:MAG: PEGA domain-containing protein [Thermoflexibacteraceae bacterium]|jgi:hypothetical protein
MTKLNFILAFILLLFSSCATITSGSKQNVVITSNPQAAKIFINDSEVGKTPFATKLLRKQTHRVKIVLDGYKPYEVQVTQGFNAWTLGNILIGGLIGLLVDAGTGAIYTLKPDNINPSLAQTSAFNFKQKDGLYVCVTLEADKNLVKVGQMEKE